MTTQYLNQNSNGIYIYRRRLPKELQTYLNKSTLKISLGRDITSAITTSSNYTQLIQQSIQVISLQHDSVERDNYLATLLEPFNGKQQKIITKPLWKSICNDYLKSIDVSSDEYRDRSYFFYTIAPAIFKTDNPDLNEITFNDVIDFQSFLNQLPKRNIQRYRDMDFQVLVSGISKSCIIIHTDDLLATRTKNKYMKWLKAIFSFAEVRDLAKNVTKSIVLKNTTKQREEREAFSTEEIHTIFEDIQNDELTYLFQVLLLTGMRRSELYKCDVDTYSGVVCFDLTTVSQGLKTASSYRIIPVHSSLLERINEFKIIRQSYTAHYLSKYFSRILKTTLNESKKKSLYSLRHSFATELISQGVTPEMVSELMGHAHSTMTMSRYVKGYPIKTLREAIECLR